MSEIESQFGERIRSCREHLGLSQKQLAEAVGTSPPNINFYERGSRSAPMSMILKLAKELGVTTDYLLLGGDQQIYADRYISAAFQAFSELKPRDRNIIIQMINVLKESR